MLLSDVPMEESDHARLRDLVAARSGLEFLPARRPQFEAAIARAVRELGLRDARQLWERLTERSGRAELEDFIASLTIGETYFFRNEPQFHALEHHVLPELIARRQATKRLRLWSAGCSSGEEPYSLAISLDRLIRDIEDWAVTIVATDINREALKDASEGVYREWSLRRTSDELRARYFTRHGDRTWELDPRIRRMVDFRYLNLVDDNYPSLFTTIHEMDLVMCRNVLIYFDDATVRTVAEKLRASIADGGWLVVGHAEPPQGISETLTPRQFPGAFLYQKDRSLLPTRPDPGPRRDTAAARPARDPVDASPARPVSSEPPAVAAISPRDRKAMALWAEGRLEDAARELELESWERPQDARPPYLLGKLNADRLHPDAARWIDEALKRNELFAPAHYVAGLIAEEEGRWEAGISALRRSIYAEPTWPLPYVALARCFLKAGRPSRGSAALTNAILLLQERAPDEPVPEGEGLTAGRLLELARIQKEAFGKDVPERSPRER